MASKLTLYIDETLVHSAKKFAQDQNTSLSGLVSEYLETLKPKHNKKIKIDPLVKKLTGVLNTRHTKKSARAAYFEHMRKKHS